MSFLEDLKFLYLRDIDKLKNEIEAYQDDSSLWAKSGSIANSGGTLCVHLCGNLRAFIGHQVGGFDYVRDREFEFSGTPVDRSELLEWIAETREWVESSLSNLSEEKLPNDFPIQPFKYKLTYQNFLLHLQGHLNYHLGQINYHRRIIEG